MVIVQWQPEYNTGHPRIDAEHQYLFDLVARLHDALQTSTSPQELQVLFTTLAIHTAEHFKHEEALMQEYNYPGYERHRQVHGNLQGKVDRLLNRFSQHQGVIGEDLICFLAEWLAHHIQGEDQSMIHFFHGHPAHARQETLII